MESSSGSSMVKLTSTNYSIWRSMMEDLLYCRDLYEPIEPIIDGSGNISKPAKPENMEEKDWEKLKRKTLGDYSIGVAKLAQT
ncbi:hypothetical protein RND71_041702 [Anisodus tanguticus]|uniref:Uncharacterized protein n=1 Tax=Anisodus tanguticus TaxID=243964 RepID=A0AAE1UX05_9SOLA|nr:hypothetical protein RND71_041702 [Anisodus tanguticus]